MLRWHAQFIVRQRRCLSQTSSSFRNKDSHRSSFDLQSELGLSIRKEIIDKSGGNYNNNLPHFTYRTFGEFIKKRRDGAKRSLLIQVKSQESSDDLIDYCQSNFGTVKSLHFHHNKDDEAFSNFFIVEFENVESAQEAVQNHARHRRDSSSHLPVYSPFMWFSGKKSSSENQASEKKPSNDSHVPIFLPSNDDVISSNVALAEKLNQFSTIEDQINALYSDFKMTSLAERVRFMACEQLEASIRGMFPRSKVLPFGSSVNSFGKRDCDLDMCIFLEDFDNHHQETEAGSRLMFHAKGGNGYSNSIRAQNQKVVDEMANIVRNFLPGCQNVVGILHAKVPIIKYRQAFLDLDCDLCASQSGYYMSELLYLWGSLDWRVRPLVFTIRKWAREYGLVQDSRPTPYLTNFSLTLMVVFFLQFKHKMLPTFKMLKDLARPCDQIIADDVTDCTFLRDFNDGVVQQQLAEMQDPDLANLSMAQLLADFFEFYGNFDYNRHAVCVVTGKLQPRRRKTPHIRNVSYFVDITNPLEPSLNVSANVQEFAVQKFRRICNLSLRKMWEIQELQESSITKPSPADEKLNYIIRGDENERASVQVKIEDLDWNDEAVNSDKSDSKDNKRKVKRKKQFFRVLMDEQSQAEKLRKPNIPSMDKVMNPPT